MRSLSIVLLVGVLVLAACGAAPEANRVSGFAEIDCGGVAAMSATQNGNLHRPSPRLAPVAAHARGRKAAGLVPHAHENS